MLQLVLFNESYSDAKNARCLDGSPSGFYWKKEAQEDKWVIFLEGEAPCLPVLLQCSQPDLLYVYTCICNFHSIHIQ